MITFNNIVERFKIFADAHFFVKSFSFGSPDDVDLSKFTSFPLMHLVYTGATYDAGTKTYNLEVYILDVPADKTKKTDRQKEVVSDAEQCAEDIIADIKNGGNIFLFAQDYEVVNATTTPLEEETKNVLSGVLLDLSVAIPYEWDACNAPIDGVTPEGGDEVAYARRGILRMLTQNGSTDVLSVRTIKVSNGTLTDEGDGVVSLDTAGAESLDELTDVNITSLTPSQLLQYSGISGNWENITIYLSTLADTKGAPSEGKFLQYTGGFWQPVDLDIELNDLSDVDTSNEESFKILRYDGANWIASDVPLVGSTGINLTYSNNVPVLSLDANLSDLNDVAPLSPSSGQVLTWSGSEWQPAPLPSPPPTVTELNDLDDVTITTPAANEILRYTGSVWSNEALTQYHERYTTEAETLRAGGAETIELYYSAQADGDGLAESAQSDTPAAGYDIRRKLYYSEAGFADPDTGTWTQFTAIADNTTFANAKAALLAYLKERTGGTVPISLKMTWEEVAQAPSFTGLLNEAYGSGAEAAYSTRRLNGNVTECMVIRRASDSTTQTIGFVDGDIDEAAIETFCTGTTCTVVTWKDQSGNGNDATAAPANEPTIYTGGALVKENGKVALDFDGSSDYFPMPSGSLPSNINNASGFAVYARAAATSANSHTVYSLGVPNVRWYGSYMYDTDDKEYFSYGSDFVVHEIGPADTQQHIVSNIAGSTQGDARAFLDGALAVTTSLQSGTPTAGAIGASNNTGSNVMDGTIQELVIYHSDKSSVRTSIEENIGDYFTQNTPLLDTYSGAAAAYSLRKLRTAYTGDAVEVYNGSSYADIGFNVFGELDTVALAAHCGSNDGFVSKWYDQAGSNDATQTQTANMPKIYDGTTGVVTEGSAGNEKPAVEFTGNTGQRLDIGGYGSTAPWTIFQVMGRTASAGSNEYIGTLRANDNYFYNLSTSGNTIRLQSRASGGVNSSFVTETVNLLGYHKIDGSSSEIALNGATVLVGTQNPTLPSVVIGKGGAVMNTGDVFFQEYILYKSDQSSNRTNIEDNINTFYSIY